MTSLFHGRNHGEVEGVARKIGERSNAALAEHDVVIALGEDVLGGHEEFVERGGHAALEENRFFSAARAFEERKVLHVARADLDDVRVFLDQVERFIVNGFGDDPETILGANLRKNLESVFAKALKAVRRSAGLVSAAAEEARAGFFDALGDSQALLLGFHGAGACDESDVLAADDDVSRGRRDPKDAVFFFRIAADELVRLAYRDAFADPRHGLEDAEVHGALVAGDADGRSNRAGDRVRFEAEAFDAPADFADLFLGGVRLHDDKHGWLPQRGE